MYNGLTAKVKWDVEVSQSFSALQGVRQGGILSTHLYKIYLNDLLLDLESRARESKLGISTWAAQQLLMISSCPLVILSCS